MKKMPILGCVLGLLLALSSPILAQERMTPELLWKLGRVSGGAVSPDGETVLYSLSRYVLEDNAGDSDLWAVPLKGGEARQLTSGPGGQGDAQWVQSARGTEIFCVTKRNEDGAQVWAMAWPGGEWRQVTKIAGGLSNLKVAPTGDAIAFTRRIKLEAEVKDLYPDLPKAEARIIDSLMYRHWDSWHDFHYSHLFVAKLDASGVAGEAKDLMPGLRGDCPLPPFGGTEQFAWSPDGKEIALSLKLVQNWAESTDCDVYLTNFERPGERTNISVGMDGYDMNPLYSPDGRYIAFQSMERPGFEADRFRIMLYDRSDGSIAELTEGLDQTTHDLIWAKDSSGLYFRSEWRGTDQVFFLRVMDRALSQVTSGQFNWTLRDLGRDGATMVFGRQDMIRPTELFAGKRGETLRRLTDVNGEVYRGLQVPTVEERWTRSTDGAMVHSWVIKPHGFDPKKRYPLITYCQGGPQGQIGQWFSYRWNFHLMAAAGYVVVAPNRRGLPGFGQAWNDQISGDWGGQAMQDILAVTDDLRDQEWIDPKRTAAVGASFGGYTVYWLMGNHENRFQAMISHCGVHNLESMYGSTEELFFVNFDLGGPYWRSQDHQAAYDRFSPHRFVGNWKTPLLVIHGEKDFRVPVTQGMEAFQAAQIEGVPSRFLYFPAEGHWVLGPQNGVLWHRVFFEWLGRWTGA